MRVFAHGAFPALAGHAGALDASERRRLRGAEVVAVEAGDGAGLQDVQFDEFHCFVLVGCELELNGLKEEKAEAESLGGTDAGVEGGAEGLFVLDDERTGGVDRA